MKNSIAQTVMFLKMQKFFSFFPIIILKIKNIFIDAMNSSQNKCSYLYHNYKNHPIVTPFEPIAHLNVLGWTKLAFEQKFFEICKKTNKIEKNDFFVSLWFLGSDSRERRSPVE